MSQCPGRCWVLHIPFVRMVKFQFLAQFPVDDLAYSVVSSLILFVLVSYICISLLLLLSLLLLSIIILEFFTPALADGLLLGFEYVFDIHEIFFYC